MKKRVVYLLLLSIFSSTGFSQFQISKDNLIKQFQGSNPKQHIFVTGNDLTSITCFDKNGKERTLSVTNRTGIRIFQNDNSKVTFYLNTVKLTDSTIEGSKTHFFTAEIKPIKLNTILRIEILR